MKNNKPEDISGPFLTKYDALGRVMEKLLIVPCGLAALRDEILL